MQNFNHERWATAVQAIRFARVCYEESIRYGMKRQTFNKLLVQHPVIRLKLANMIRQIEATQSWLEALTYQMQKMTAKAAQSQLAGPLALLKVQATTTFEYCAREAAQIFGGLAYTRGGQGDKVERLLPRSARVRHTGRQRGGTHHPHPAPPTPALPTTRPRERSA